MQLFALGSGSAFTTENFQSNFILHNPRTGRRLLIDAGGDLKFSLKAAGIKLAELTDGYVSHLHGDHCYGYEYVAFGRHFSRCPRLKLFIHPSLIKPFWRFLSVSVRSLQFSRAALDTYFDVCPVGPNEGLAFEWEGQMIQLVQTLHVMDGTSFVPSFGLFMELDGVKVLLTTDTQFLPDQLKPWYTAADLIFHDCETSPYASGVHPHFDKLRGLDEAIRAKTWLYHWNDGPLPDARQAGFLGFVQRGQVFDFAAKATNLAVPRKGGTTSLKWVNILTASALPKPATKQGKKGTDPLAALTRITTITSGSPPASPAKGARKAAKRTRPSGKKPQKV